MHVFGSLVVQNEADVIEDLLDYLGKIAVFDRIFFFDLGSEDDTFERALKFKGLLHEPQVLNVPYSNALRRELLLRNRRLYRSGDWVAIIDADEFYAEDPLAVLEFADDEGADSVWTWQAEYQFTDADLAGLDQEDPARPIYERRRRYLVDWSELRFFKYLPGRYEGPIGSLSPCSKRILNRHYPLRSPAQIQNRIRTRVRNRVEIHDRPHEERWPQIFSEDWRDYVMPHQVFHEDTGGAIRFGLPPGVAPEDYLSANPFGSEMGTIALRLAAEREASLSAEPRIVEPAADGLRIRRLDVDRSRSVLRVECEDASGPTAIIFDGSALNTTREGDDVLAAVLPDAIQAAPGYYPVVLARDRERSNVVDLVVEP